MGCCGRLPQVGWEEEEEDLADQEAVVVLLQQESGPRAMRKQERVWS